MYANSLKVIAMYVHTSSCTRAAAYIEPLYFLNWLFNATAQNLFISAKNQNLASPSISANVFPASLKFNHPVLLILTRYTSAYTLNFKRRRSIFFAHAFDNDFSRTGENSYQH